MVFCAEKSKRFTWERRLNIALGAAKGLEVLNRARIYGSMRPSNILITHDFQPLVKINSYINIIITQKCESVIRDRVSTIIFVVDDDSIIRNFYTAQHLEQHILIIIHKGRSLLSADEAVVAPQQL